MRDREKYSDVHTGRVVGLDLGNVLVIQLAPHSLALAYSATIHVFFLPIFSRGSNVISQHSSSISSLSISLGDGNLAFDKEHDSV